MSIPWWDSNNHRVSVCGFTEWEWVVHHTVVLQLVYIGLSMSEENSLLQISGNKVFLYFTPVLIFLSLMESIVKYYKDKFRIHLKTYNSGF